MADHTQNLMALTRSVAEAAHLGTEGLIMNAGVLLAEHFDARIQAEETAGRQHASAGGVRAAWQEMGLNRPAALGCAQSLTVTVVRPPRSPGWQSRGGGRPSPAAEP